MLNKIIVEKQNTGKTTYLLNEIEKIILNNENLIIMDSATEHVDKSLLKKVINTYDNCIEVVPTDKNLISINNYSLTEFVENYKQQFPFEIIKQNANKIICFDLSYFLEKGHEFLDNKNDLETYKYYRKLYNDLSQQIALILILSEKDGIINNINVVTDEIEFPIVDYDMSLFQKDIKFLSSVHSENAFGTFYNSFEKATFKVYKKRGLI